MAGSVSDAPRRELDKEKSEGVSISKGKSVRPFCKGTVNFRRGTEEYCWRTNPCAPFEQVTEG